MYYSDEIVEEVREKNDIVAVISGYVSLKKKGNNHWGCCPFHNEKTPSFAVSENKQMYHCFGCGESGNVYTFLMKYENYSFPEAVKALADRAGVALPELEYTEEQKRKANRRQRLLDVNKDAATFFYYQLRKNPHGEIGLAYFKKRQLTEETMKKFGLGFAGKNGGELVAYLRQKGYRDDEIQGAGLATHSERSGLSSQFWNRVMFPIQDINHRVIGFGGRVMGDGEPKYLNSPETDIFDKRRNLYGLNYARTARSGNMILCEGYMDVIAMHQAGYTQAVASLGTAFTPEQAHLLHRYTDQVYLAYDSDGAGVKAALRAIGILRDEGLTAKVINMRPHKDPDEFMKALGKEAFQERIDQAENSFFYEIRMMESGFQMQDPEEKTKFHREIAKKLCTFEEEVERENYLQAVAEKYYIGVENLRKLVISYAGSAAMAKPVERPKSGIQSKNQAPDGGRRAQKLLITWIADYPKIYDKIKPYVSAEDFTEDLYRQVAERMFAAIEKGKFQAAEIINTFEDENQQKEAAKLFYEELPALETTKDKEQALHDVLYAVKKNSYESFKQRQEQRDIEAVSKVLAAKKALMELEKLHVSIE